MAVLFFVAAGMFPPAFADHGKKGMGYGGGLHGMFFMKAHFMLIHGEQLGLSEDQMRQIKDLKVEVKKYLVSRDAEVELKAIDINAALHESPVNTQAISALIDEKYALKSAKAKYLVDAIVKLKSMLSDEQMSMLKSMWKGSKAKYGHHGR